MIFRRYQPIAAFAGDPYFSSVVLLAVNNNGADGTTTFTDQSASAKTLTAVGNAQWDTDQAPPSGLASWALFDGTGDRITAADSNDWNFGSGDFTVECWFRTAASSGNPNIVSQWSQPDQKSWLIEFDPPNTLNFYYSTDGSAGTSKACGTISTNTTYFCAASRVGNTLDCYLDTARGSTTDVTGVTLFNSTAALRIGGSDAAAGLDLNGWIAAVRVTKGVGRYSGATIVVPTLPLMT